MKRWWLIGLLLVGLEVLLFQATHRAQAPTANSSLSRSGVGAASGADGGASGETTAAVIPPGTSSPGDRAPENAASATAQTTAAQTTAAQTVRYQTYALPQATAHVLTIPAGGAAIVKIGVASGVDSLKNFAEASGAVGAINGGFFDPANLLTTSYVVQGGQLVADPRMNDRLMQNPDLTSYIGEILNRSEFRRYQCADGVRYAITPQDEPTPANCQLVDSLGAGPQLLPVLTLEQEGFVATQNGAVIRDALGYRQPNARSAIGLTEAGDVVMVMVQKQPTNPSNSGISLPALAEFMKTLGVTQALNLDGGGSSSLYYEGKTIFGSVDANGNPAGRSVKSVLLVVPATP